MYEHISDMYGEIKDKLLHRCVACGRCISQCRVTPDVEYDKAPGDVMRDVLAFLRGEPLSGDAEKKAFSCLHCIGCSDIKCPIGVRPLQVNELIRHELEIKKAQPWSEDIFAQHQQRLQSLTTPKQLARVTTPRIKKGSRYVFFPGCSIYKQPEKVENCLDIMDAITDDYSFLPGLTYCCGFPHYRFGDFDAVEKKARGLLEAVEEIGAQQLVLFCPTCMCHMHDRLPQLRDIPCECVTFGKFILDNIGRLSFPNAKPHRVTYHEPCKLAYSGLDPGSMRGVLRAIPGTELIEMAHHGEDAMCCGCDADPDTRDIVTRRRLAEAKDTGADTLIDLCTTCHWIFSRCLQEHGGQGFAVDNFSTYVTRAMGIERDDTMDEA